MPITSSSISSSEDARERRWARFGRAILASAAGLALLLWAGLLALDPYGTGHFRPGTPPPVLDQGSRTAGASRGRDPAFDGALIGNSHLQLVAPAALADASGIPFVSLSVTATGPKEQLAVLDWFLAHRVRPLRALVIGTDDFWCTGEPDHAHWEPFPFWLYDRSAGRYAAGLFRYSSFDAALRRISALVGRGATDRARRDGYSDFERDQRWSEATRNVDLSVPKPSPFVGRTGRFPAIEALGRRLAALPEGTAVVLVRPPVYATALPEPGSDLARAESACLDALTRLASSRRRTALVDWRRPLPALADPALFFDHDHYRGPVARALEADIGAALRRIEALDQG